MYDLELQPTLVKIFHGLSIKEFKEFTEEACSDSKVCKKQTLVDYEIAGPFYLQLTFSKSTESYQINDGNKTWDIKLL